ncbi:MAG TPA: class I SAM-dependent methyltransferase [Solirubrobacteraceae bacterium]|nr:class I SAM-dependent methyltransferase [Solirubrobacteraceae bacterium]
MTGQSDRLAREQAFHDARFAHGDSHRSADRFYAINRASDAYFRMALDAARPGARVLDYGCGDGAYGALHAAIREDLAVTAIDLSPVAIEHARERARSAGVEDRIDFRVMNAEALELPDDEFDYVVGLGVLHHLDLAAALREITRVLKPDGGGVFVEPLGHNPLINLYRRGTPEQRTSDEHPLLLDDLDLIARSFRSCDASFFHLFGLLALPLGGTRAMSPAVRTLDALDQACFRRFPSLRRHAWMVGLTVAGPVG